MSLIVTTFVVSLNSSGTFPRPNTHARFPSDQSKQNFAQRQRASEIKQSEIWHDPIRPASLAQPPV